jgi:hypothetical protein
MMEMTMRSILLALVMTVYAASGGSAHPKDHRTKAHLSYDRLSYSELEAKVPQTPAFHWAGRSSWGSPSGGEQHFLNESANGS